MYIFLLLGKVRGVFGATICTGQPLAGERLPGAFLLMVGRGAMPCAIVVYDVCRGPGDHEALAASL
jgi:hypothetical protein